MAPESRCEHVSHRLPWRLNGTLSEAEAREVDEHLATCAACRRDWEETAEAAGIFDAHPPAEALTALVWDQEVAGFSHEELSAHLASCPACAEALELARQSRRLEEEKEGGTVVPLAPRSPRSRPWPRLAAAAAVVAAVSLTGWLVSWRQQTELRGSLAAPEANPVVAEIFPEDLILRGEPRLDTVTVPAGDRHLTLVLASQDRTEEGPFRLELLDAADSPVWSLEDLIRQPTGDFTVTLPARDLAAGVYTLRLLSPSDEAPVETFSFELRRLD